MAEPGGCYREFFYSARDGLRLHARIYGEGSSGLPVVCLPGLTRNVRDFHQLACHLSTDCKNPHMVVAFDYRGRGRSAYDADWRRYDVSVEADDIANGLSVLGIEHAAFIGTSRGGLVTMALASTRPGLLKAAILNDIGPVIEGDGLAQIRASLQRAPIPETLSEAARIQKSIHGAAFCALSDEDWRRFAEALYVQKAGKLRGDFDPKLLRTLYAINLNRPLPELWPQFDGLARIPVLAIRGENSRLLSAETLATMASRHPNLQQIVVPGQGHAPLLETDDLPKQIAAFLNRIK
ncbi:alpha/beta hydrolase [Nitratireductor sp. GISD-1A_MAKvit]|uniref:alpha/beta fold hydrolase n=1 Tax=Nitratireductor sp. GISD-1A_MAKvit TaxID=3234198 RepID=UPI003466A4C7